jgi:AraC-like DNA-binding protein
MNSKSVDAETAIAAQLVIQKNFRNKITIQEIASLVNVGERTLIRAFKNHFGQNIYEYVLRLRMEKAKEHLEARKLVKEVAMLVGYKRHSSFTKQFVKFFGMSPSDWNSN